MLKKQRKLAVVAHSDSIDLLTFYFLYISQLKLIELK